MSPAIHKILLTPICLVTPFCLVLSAPGGAFAIERTPAQQRIARARGSSVSAKTRAAIGRVYQETVSRAYGTAVAVRVAGQLPSGELGVVVGKPEFTTIRGGKSLFRLDVEAKNATGMGPKVIFGEVDLKTGSVEVFPGSGRSKYQARQKEMSRLPFGYLALPIEHSPSAKRVTRREVDQLAGKKIEFRLPTNTLGDAQMLVSFEEMAQFAGRPFARHVYYPRGINVAEHDYFRSRGRTATVGFLPEPKASEGRWATIANELRLDTASSTKSPVAPRPTSLAQIRMMLLDYFLGNTARRAGNLKRPAESGVEQRPEATKGGVRVPWRVTPEGIAAIIRAHGRVLGVGSTSVLPGHDIAAGDMKLSPGFETRVGADGNKQVVFVKNGKKTEPKD